MPSKRRPSKLRQLSERCYFLEHQADTLRALAGQAGAERDLLAGRLRELEADAEGLNRECGTLSGKLTDRTREMVDLNRTVAKLTRKCELLESLLAQAIASAGR
jgi:chromosome segregation ATPase